MLLAQDVHDQQGRLLMPRDTALTDRHLRAFELWGILAVQVQQAGAESGPPELVITPEELAQAEALVSARLAHNDLTHPMIATLFRICTEREARRLALLRHRHA